VAFFYNATIFTDDRLRTKTAALLHDGTNVQVIALPYKRANEFPKLYHDQILRDTNSWDLILGPTESAALKALNDSLEAKPAIPFLAPFVTTHPKAFRRLLLVPAGPSDEERISLAVGELVECTAPRLLAILHTDDFWGRTVVKTFRESLNVNKLLVHPQPVDEFAEEEADEGKLVADNRRLYTSFLEEMRESGATLIAVALITPEAYNQFFDSLHEYNAGLLVGYKPTILLLSQPGFHPDRINEGVLYKHLAEFNVFYVADCLRGGLAENSLRSAVWAAHLDVCRVIAHAAQEVAGAGPLSTWPKDAVNLVLEFYKGIWKEEHAKSLYPQLMTGYHAAKLHVATKQIELRQASATDHQLKEKSVSDDFKHGYLRRVGYGIWFFLLHHRALWSCWTVLLFTLVALASFYHASQLKSEQPTWMLLKTTQFWSLFLWNLLLTYLIWVLSLYFGFFNDTNLAAPLVLAAACPTAGSALGNIARRYLPFDVTGILRIIEDLNNKLLESVGKEKLEQYKARLEQLSLDVLKTVFFEVLFLRLTSDDLRNRILDQFHKKLARQQVDLEKLQKGSAGITDDMLKEHREKLERTAYASSLLTALGYLCSNEAQIGEQLDKLLARYPEPGTVVPERTEFKEHGPTPKLWS